MRLVSILVEYLDPFALELQNMVLDMVPEMGRTVMDCRFRPGNDIVGLLMKTREFFSGIIVSIVRQIMGVWQYSPIAEVLIHCPPQAVYKSIGLKLFHTTLVIILFALLGGNFKAIKLWLRKTRTKGISGLGWDWHWSVLGR